MPCEINRMPSWHSRMSLYVLTFILAVAAFFDVRQRRIPNSLILAGLTASLPMAAVSAGVGGMLDALAGLLVGGGMLLPFFALGLLGAGDVKLMAVVGSLAGLGGIWQVLLYTALAGGILGVVAILASARAKAFFSGLAAGWPSLTFLKMTNELPLHETTDRGMPRIPYAVAIAAGSLAWMLNRS